MTTSIPPNTLIKSHKFQFLLGRIAWILIIIPVFAFFLSTIPDRAEQLFSVCQVSSDCARAQLSLAELLAILNWGLTLQQYAIYILSIEVLFVLSFFITASAILWNKPKDWMAVFTAFMLITLGMSIFPTMTAQAQSRLIIHMFQFASSGSILIFVYLFPDGKFIPGWTKFLVIPWLIWVFIHNLIPDSPFNIAKDSVLIELLIALAFYATGLLAQIYRYKLISTPTQQQQTKWVIFGLTIALLGFAAYWVAFLLLPLREGQELVHLISTIISQPLYALALLFIPTTLAISIQQFRLWEIDPIINRSMVYGLLSIILGLIYFGSIIVLQYLFRNLTSQDSQLAIVGSTLTTAVMFSPLRSRIQSAIDRRYYRQKYTADQILNQFKKILKTETDLATLSEQLEQVVEAAFQPKFIILWLSPDLYQINKQQEEYEK